MRLPIVTSQQVCEELESIRPDVKIILSSGYLEDDATEGFDRHAIAGYLQKPYRFDRTDRLHQAGHRLEADNWQV